VTWQRPRRWWRVLWIDQQRFYLYLEHGQTNLRTFIGIKSSKQISDRLLLPFLEKIIPSLFHIWLVLRARSHSVFTWSAAHARDERINDLATYQLSFLGKNISANFLFWKVTMLSQLLRIICGTNINV
jgi:hypothetical protein